MVAPKGWLIVLIESMSADIKGDHYNVLLTPSKPEVEFE